MANEVSFPMKRSLIALALLAVACTQKETPAAASTPAPPAPKPAAIGDARRGNQLIAQYGCTVCHAIPGIEGPQGALAPTLAGVATRPKISEGTVQNSPQNLAKYVENPQALNPNSSMPALGIPPADTKDIAAYLVTLK